jgi:hypothetical protein
MREVRTECENERVIRPSRAALPVDGGMLSQAEVDRRNGDFQYWLSEMDDALARFLEGIDEPVRSQLDLSPESLDALETWVLKRYKSPDELLETDAKRVLDGVARYIGETYRKHVGGQWQIRLDDPKYAFFGLPELTGFSEKPTPISPHSLATAMTDRRSGMYLRTILQNTKKRLAKT